MSLHDEIKKRLALSREHPDRFSFNKQAAVSLIINEHDEKGASILFIKRVHHPDDPWSGHMAFPGGHLEIGQETPLEASMRETREEVGLDLSALQYLGALDDFQVHFRGHPVNFMIFPHVFLSPKGQSVATIPDASEVAGIHWIDLEFFNSSLNMANLPYVLNDNTVELPSFTFGEEKIWGISYLILMDLFQKLSGVKLPNNIGNKQFDSSHWIHYPHYSKNYK